jgi:hypothetical protein
MHSRRLIRAALIVAWLLAASSPAYADPLQVETSSGPYPLYKQSKALIIGQSKYDNWDPLDRVPPQVSRIRDALSGYDSVEVWENLGERELRDKIRDFLTLDTQLDERLLLYFAGHGDSDGNKNPYVLPVDVPKKGDPREFSKALSLAEIKAFTQVSTAKHIFLVFDSCLAGDFFKTRGDIEPTQASMTDIDQRVRLYLTSGSFQQNVPDDDRFTDAFVDALSGKAEHIKDGILTATEVGPWVKGQATTNLQTPQFGIDPETRSRAGDVVLALTDPADSANLAVSDDSAFINVAAAHFLETQLPLTANKLHIAMPEDFEFLTSSVVVPANPKDPSVEELIDMTSQLSAVLASRSDTFSAAPAERVTQLLESTLGLLQRIRSDEGAETCGALLSFGSKALVTTGKWEKYRKPIDDILSSYLEVALEGRKSPLPIVKPTWSDNDRLEDYLESLDLPKDHLLNESDPAEKCDVFIKALGSLPEIEGGTGDRLRARLMQSAAFF